MSSTGTFCAIDFETANPARGSVCAVGVAKFDTLTGALIRTEGGLVTPPAGLEQFNPYNMRVHHISPRKIAADRGGRGAASWDEVLPWLIRFVGDDWLFAHNAPFERSVLAQASQAVGHEVPDMTHRVFCTVKISRHELPGLPKHKLPDVVDALGLPSMRDMHHDAGADAVACGSIVGALMRTKQLDLATLVKRSGQQLHRMVQPKLV